MVTNPVELWQWFAHSDAGLAFRIGVAATAIGLLGVADQFLARPRSTRWIEYLILLVAVIVALIEGAGLTIRVVLGATVLGLLALIDLYTNGCQAKRWREYLFLLIAVFVGLAYGIANDQITCRLSWEYFYYGKELSEILGDKIPPDYRQLSWEATKVGMKATWTMGLLIGVFILLANNPREGRPSLPYIELLKRLPMIVGSAILFAMILSWVGHAGGLTYLSNDFREMVAHNDYRPYEFMRVYGIHLGGYIGGFFGMVGAIVSIVRQRGKMIERVATGRSPSLASGETG